MTLQDTIHHTEQIANAIQRHGQSVYVMPSEGDAIDFEGERIITLPNPQRAGTMTQQRSYAVDKAQELLIKYNKI